MRSEAVRSTSISKDLRRWGARIEIENGMITATADELIGCHIYMDVVSVGATINVMMAAGGLAKGNTTIEKCGKRAACS